MLDRALAASLLLLAVAPAALHGQSEAALKEYFEGRTVKLKLSMPGTEAGVDVFPGTAKPLDFSRHAERLKGNGAALRSGDEALVTKVRVKSKLIEFQLDGGGYGTMGDDTSPNVGVSDVPKSKREQHLEAELKREKDAVRRRAMAEELDDLEAERERENARNHASVAAAQESKKANIRQRRLEGGSRFNIRYAEGVPASAVTPESVRQALAAYVDFSEPPASAGAAGTPPAIPVSGTDFGQPAAGGLPRKGMLLDDVDRLLGTPRKSTERKEGKLTVTTRAYATGAGLLSAEFVEGVLIRYTMTSN
jgi:hypothetical protein